MISIEYELKRLLDIQNQKNAKPGAKNKKKKQIRRMKTI